MVAASGRSQKRGGGLPSFVNILLKNYFWDTIITLFTSLIPPRTSFDNFFRGSVEKLDFRQFPGDPPESIKKVILLFVNNF